MRAIPRAADAAYVGAIVDGCRVARWEVADWSGGPAPSERRVDDLEGRMQALESQVSELAERLDFAERLLAQARERSALPKG